MRCEICTGDLREDDHHTSEYGDGFAHDDCIDDEARDEEEEL